MLTPEAELKFLFCFEIRVVRGKGMLSMQLLMPMKKGGWDVIGDLVKIYHTI